MLRMTRYYLARVTKRGAQGAPSPEPWDQSAVQGDTDFYRHIANLVGIKRPEPNLSEELAGQLIERRIAAALRVQEHLKKGDSPLEGIPEIPRRNLLATAKMLGLSELEAECLALIVFLSGDEPLRRLSSILSSDHSNMRVYQVFAEILVQPVASVRLALSAQGKLMSCQLVRLKPMPDSLPEKFEWSSANFRHAVLLPDFDPLNALRDRIASAPAPTITWDKFKYLGDLHHVLRSYLKRILESRKSGVNVLLYGPPGCGKNELTRALAAELGCELYEVSTEDNDGDPIDGMQRLRALRLLHSLCGGRTCLTVFDEAEDIWPAPHPFLGPLLRNPSRKGWVNGLLENTRLPTFWLTNSVAAIDPAYVRRFDLVVEVRGPTAENREEILRSLPLALPEPAVRRLAACEHLAPAVMSRAAAVVQAMADDVPECGRAQTFEAIINQTLTAQGHGRLGTHTPIGETYDPGFINADFNPVELLEGVRRSPSARILLWGPPGTGKSALAVWMAQQLGRPAHVKRASDLLSAYVGQAEKNVAEAFRAAADAEAVLILDEVDGFLCDRSKAVRNYEVSIVNEFLTQMEAFSGLLICTTNFQGNLDQASFRRFDLKAKLDYLRPEQAKSLLASHLSVAGLAAAEPECLAKLETLTSLAPGDFAAVSRQHRFKPCSSADAWVAALANEVSSRGETNRRVVGFARDQAERSV